jgi:predicted GH43/DUF377 family glycosyl hydrolase
MKWSKKGLIYCPDKKYSWAKHSALQPTPHFISDSVIRIYVGFRDENGVSRIGFVDVDAKNPSSVLKVSVDPVLDIGIPGTFDENGVAPCAVVRRNGRLYLYYAGYQLGQKVRFYVFAGLAISEDGGNSFARYSKAPILDRTENELLFRVIHSVIFEDGVWRVWYGGGSEFIERAHKMLPVYNVRYTESEDGIKFKKEGRVCVDLESDDEYRIGRPYVIKDEGMYKMFYGVATISKGYRLGYAESPDGLDWIRKDEEMGIDASESGWDSRMNAYPSIMKYKDCVYLFYNGNNFGYDGFGYAVLDR